MNTSSSFDIRNFSTKVFEKPTFKPFGRNNPCPVCGKADIDCRYNANDFDFVQCHTFADSRKGEKINGFVCVKSSAGHTASFKPDNNLFSKDGCKPRELVKEPKPKVEVKADTLQLSDDELHRYFERVIAELPLPTGKAEERLLTRGYTQKQLKENGIRLLPKWFKPSFTLPQAFPGQIWIKEKTDRVLGRHKEFVFIPIINDGKFCAATLEDLNPNEDESKYRRHSNEHFRFHRYGEQPIQVYLPDGNHKQVWLGIEGGAHKPILFHLKSGHPVIAGMGCNLSSSPHLLAKAVKKAKAKYGDEVEFIGIVPDAGSVSNKQVVNDYCKNLQAFKNLGIENAKVAWWNQITKNDCGDIDELESLDGIRYISSQEFFAIAEKELAKVGEQKEGEKKTRDSSDESQDWARRNWLKKRSYTPDVTLNQTEFKFPKLPDNNLVIAAKSGLGSGKTVSLIELIRLSPNRAFLIGYRNNLLLQTGSRASQQGVSIYHLQHDDGKLIGI